jgi:F0F1-type ATP synthase assembly protein I
MDSGRNNVWASVGRYVSLAFILPASTFAGYVIGYLLDRALGTGFLSIVFLLLGIAAGFIELLRKLPQDT